jgi:hypothetical protein
MLTTTVTVHLQRNTVVNISPLYEVPEKAQYVMFDKHYTLLFEDLNHLIAFRDRIDAYLGDTRVLSSDEAPVLSETEDGVVVQFPASFAEDDASDEFTPVEEYEGPF